MPLKNGTVTPSQLASGPRSAGKSHNKNLSGGSSGDRSRSPYVSPTVEKIKKQGKLNKSVKSDKSDKENVSIEVDSLDSSSLCRSLWDTKKCPCNVSSDAWQIDCSQCQQYWHVNCVTLNGLTEREINKLVNWLCPFCYVAPVSTSNISPDSESSCLSCRNTRVLRDSNHQFEVAAAASNLQSIMNQRTHEPENLKAIETVSKTLASIDLEKLTDSLKLVQNLDLHLQHLLVSDSGLQKFQSLPNQIAMAIDEKLSQSTSTLASAVSSHDKSLNTLSKNINKLQEDLQRFSSSTSPTPSAFESTDKLLTDISSKLDKLCSDESGVSNGLGELKQSIQSLQCSVSQIPPTSANAPSASHPTPTGISHNTSAPVPSVPHAQVPVTDTMLEFIEQSESVELVNYLETCTFKFENGHSVASFGVPYHYTGSKSSTAVPPIPQKLQPLFDKINNIQTEIYKKQYPDQPNLSPPVINSCLVNKYEGPTSHLPKHSDREVTIHPESSIFCLSLGQSCDIKFSERESGNESSHACPDRSLYLMTRRSQEVFEHCIEAGSVPDGIRYSLTFRAVSWTNKNATCLIGDSNTGFLRFGSDKRNTFGELMPGQKFWAPRIENIDPVSCMGYANVVLLCGINDVRQSNVRSEKDVADLHDKLKLKVKQILKLSPRTAVYVCRLLPTRDSMLNMKVDTFNRLIFFDLVPTCGGVVYVEGFERLACNHVLADELSKQFDRNGRPDTLHLNRLGARVLAGLIKRSVFLRLNGGVDRRKHTSRVDGRSYRTALGDPPAPQRSW